ncbi:FHA domain-containing protein [bacterium]|nr:FHA domain-containing protein [bacterium]
MEIKVTNPKGKTRTEVFDKAIIRIGTDESNDICLSSKDILPFHLQTLNFKNGEQKNRVVNLTDLSVAITLNQEAYWLGPYAYSEINNGDEVELGDFKLQFNLPIKGGQVRTSPHFKASLEFPTNVLPSETMLEGILTLHNTGEKAGCQFKIDVEGLPEDCYQIDSIPLLYPSAVENIPFRLFHQGTAPKVGYQTFFVKLSSPDKYPDHEVVIQHNIYISPYFKQTLEIIELSDDSRELIEQPANNKKQWKTITFENSTRPPHEKANKESLPEVQKEIVEDDIQSPQSKVIDDKPISTEELATQNTDQQQLNIETSNQVEEDTALPISDTPILDEEIGKSQESSNENLKGIPQLNNSNVKVIGKQFEDFWEDKE